MGLSRSTRLVSSSDLRTRVRRFYAYQTASSFAIWIPFWALWIRGHLSSDFDFTLVDVAFWVGLLVFQLPVGVVADRTPRRRTIVLSELFRSAGILGYGLSATFWGYVAANVVWSLGAAFSIGTSAYLYEVLLESGHETEFPRYIGRVTMIQLLSNAAGAFVGGVFVGVVGDLRLTLLVGAILNLGAVGVAVTFREPKVERTPESTYVEQLVQGLRVVRRREGVALRAPIHRLDLAARPPARVPEPPARAWPAGDRVVDGRLRVHLGPRSRRAARGGAHDNDRAVEPRPLPRGGDVLPVRLHPRALAHDRRRMARGDSVAVAADRRAPRLAVPPPPGTDEST